MTDFDQELDRQLQQLPPPHAPGTLLPRVLVAVGRRDRSLGRSPWYRRPWLTWPRGWQLGSAAIAMLVIASFVVGAPVLNWISPGLAVNLGPFESLGHLVGQASTLTRVFWHVWLAPIAFYLAAFVVVLSLAVTAALSLVNSVVCLPADAPHA